MVKFAHHNLSLDLTHFLPQNGADLKISATGSTVEKFRHRLESGNVGFYDWPEAIPHHLIREMRDVVDSLKARCEGAVIFGIGGSFLGGMAIEQALKPYLRNDKFPIFWVGNSDPGVIANAESFLAGKKCAAVVISKSGNTTETMASFFHLSGHFAQENIVGITDPQHGELRRLVESQGWKSFPVPPSIGGRFSVLTAVGLFPCLLLGFSAEKVLMGAVQIRNELDSQGLASALQYAALLAHWDRSAKKNVHVFMPYRDGLKRLSEWYVQLWGESIGKKHPLGGSVGATPLSALGTSDQHSLLQLFKEGPSDKIVGFLTVQERPDEPCVAKPGFPTGTLELTVGKTFSRLTNDACSAVEKSLSLAGVPTYRFTLPTLCEESLGAFFFFQMTACALAGEIYGIDAFDQPGVEEAKVLLKKSLLAG